MKKLVGTDAVIAMTLEKIELCARRAVAKKYPNEAPPESLMAQFSSELAYMLREMCS